MTVNSEKVLNYLKENYGKEFSKQEVAKTLGISLAAVTGTVNSLRKKEYVVDTREEVIEDVKATDTRKAKTHTVKYHMLTEKGLNYDPVAEEAAKQAEKERKAAERAAEKAAKKNEA